MRRSQENSILSRSLNQKRVIYLIVRKKRGRLIGEEKNALHKKY